jgi:hypothetical protein
LSQEQIAIAAASPAMPNGGISRKLSTMLAISTTPAVLTGVAVSWRE